MSCTGYKYHGERHSLFRCSRCRAGHKPAASHHTTKTHAPLGAIQPVGLLLAQGQKGTESTRNCAQSSMSSRQNRKVGCGRHNVACCAMPCCSSRGLVLLTAMLCPCSNRVCRDADYQQTRVDSTQQQIHGNILTEQEACA